MTRMPFVMAVTESDKQAIQNAKQAFVWIIREIERGPFPPDFSVLLEIRKCLRKVPGPSWK